MESKGTDITILRVQIQFKPGLTVTEIGNTLHLLPEESYLQITTCLELQQLNTSNTEELRVGESCYLYFPFSEHYLGYKTDTNELFLTKMSKEKSAFKIICNRFNWSSRGNIELGTAFSYRIVVAELNARVLTNVSGTLQVLIGQDEDASLVALKPSLYGTQGPAPCRIVDLQSGLTLCYRNRKTCCHLKPSLCEYMMQIENKPGEPQYLGSNIAIKHVNSKSYLIKSGKEYVFLKQAPQHMKFCLRSVPYAEGHLEYTRLQTQDGNWLHLVDSSGCQTSTNPLQAMVRIQSIGVRDVDQIIIPAWLKSEIPLAADTTRIYFLLEECYSTIKAMADIYQFEVVDRLLQEGLFADLEMLFHKYEWHIVGSLLTDIVALILHMNTKWIVELFGVPDLYLQLMEEPKIFKKVLKIRLFPEDVSDSEQLLQNLHSLIFRQNSISLTIIGTLLVASPLVLSTEHALGKQINNYMKYACEKMVPQIQKKSISSFFSLGLKLVQVNSTEKFFSENVLAGLSVNLVQEDGLSLEDKLDLIQFFQCEVGPYAYIATEDHSIRLIVPDHKHEPSLSHYTGTIFPTNPRFESYQPKLLSICLLSYYIQTNQVIDMTDYQENLKYIMENMNNYNYEENPELFLKYCLKAIKLILQRLHLLVVAKILEFDSALDFGKQVQKCFKELEALVKTQLLDISMLWDIFKEDTISEKAMDLFLLNLAISESIIYPYTPIKHLLRIMKMVEQPSAFLIKCISLFLQREHSFNPKLASQKLIQQFKHMKQQEMEIIATIIHENNMYSKICYKSQAFYHFMNMFSAGFGDLKPENAKNKQKQQDLQDRKEKAESFRYSYNNKNKEDDKLSEHQIALGNFLDGIKIMETIMQRRGPWLYIDSQYLFLKNLLQLIGGVVSMDIYQDYEKYICSVEPEKWSLHFFKLCQAYFEMSPAGLKKRFVIQYHHHLKQANKDFKLEKLFFEKGAQSIVAYINLLLAFTKYHSSKYLLYEIMGDETLFNLLFKFSKSIELRIRILELMIESRRRFNSYEQITQNPENQQFLKKGTQFIREKLSLDSNSFYSENLQEYVCTLLDFLFMREEISLHTQLTEDELMIVEGTNKIFAFRLSEMIGVMIRLGRIDRQVVEKIQWFEGHYKIGIDTIQLTQISVELQRTIIVSQNFKYNYMLSIPEQIQATATKILGKISQATLTTMLIKICLSLSFSSENRKSMRQCLHYLHYIVSFQQYLFEENDIQLLLLSMMRSMETKKLDDVALMQNILRKIILKDGKLQIKYQSILHNHFLANKNFMFLFLKQSISNYITFSPLYESTLNYFNHNGQNSICWTVSQYISMLRFLISLCKTLDLQFKAIFSESEHLHKQFIGSLIEINRQHIKELFKDTSDTKLTIIAYEIELINNMMLGPVDINIRTALKFKYQEVLALIRLPDQQTSKLKTSTIIIKIKKFIVEGMLILANIHKFEAQQIQQIEEGLILYYKTTKKLVKDDMDSLMDNYSKQKMNNKLSIINFDLALSMYYCILKIYEKKEIEILNKMKTDSLREARLIKSYNKKFKMFYQLYRIIVDIFDSIAKLLKKCCQKTTSKIDEAVGLFNEKQLTHEENLYEVFLFFVKNVSKVEIQVGKQLQTVYFLLLKETQCYNTSIRKQLHRRVGLGEREYKILRFSSEINYIIVRLEIEKEILETNLKYRPFQIIVNNRQLWKSLNFLCACVINIMYLDQVNMDDQQQFQTIMIILRACSLFFSFFLFIIYFVKNLPMKIKLSWEMINRKDPSKFNTLKSCLQILNDKTLWFATIYTVVIMLSFFYEGSVAILMLDFFVRFKISKKVTEIVTRPIKQLFLIILASAQIAFVFTFYMYFLNEPQDCSNIRICIQKTYFLTMRIQKNSYSQIDFSNIRLRTILYFFGIFFAILISNSLIISVLFFQKKTKDKKISDWEDKVKKRCFICDYDRSAIDRARNNNKGFSEHIEEEHNLWSYIFYLIYLKNKELESLNVVESMVLRCWRDNTIDWFPSSFTV